MAGIDINGKTVVITGGSRGLGLALAREFASRGANLALLARNAQELKDAANDPELQGVEVHTEVFDVKVRSEIRRALRNIAERFGRIDVLVNNAGVIQTGPWDTLELADYDESLRVHLWGPLYMIRQALPFLERTGDGRIVNISSLGGRISVPHLMPYCVGKFALAGLSEGMSAEFIGKDVKVTSVYPGLMRTGSPLHAQFKGDTADEFAWFGILDNVPLITMDPRRAAKKIVRGALRGKPVLTISWTTKLAVAAHGIAPNTVNRAIRSIVPFLPKGNQEPFPQELVEGQDVPDTRWARFAKRVVNRAAERYNETRNEKRAA